MQPSNILEFDDDTLFDENEGDFPLMDSEAFSSTDDIVIKLEEECITPLEDDDEMQQEKPEVENPKQQAICELENMVLDFLGQLADGIPKQSTQASRKAIIKLQLADRRKPPSGDGEMPTRVLTFSQKSTQLFRTVDLMHEALLNDTPTTKRDMFYKDVNLFGSQATLNRLVDDVAATVGVSRGDLNVRASMKGLICGSGLTLTLRGGIRVTIHPTESTLIPSVEDIEQFDVDDDLSWVLVVEKEAIFQTLCHTAFARHPQLKGTGLVITGKGYPDIATRQLVSALANNLPDTIPFVGIVDCDPHGIDILSVYKYGSHSMFHERETLIAPRLLWGGVQSGDLSSLSINKDYLVPVTKHDERKALSMLRREGLPQEWRKELQKVLHSRRKAEIEILSSHFDVGRSTEDKLTNYIVEKIIHAQNVCSQDTE